MRQGCCRGCSGGFTTLAISGAQLVRTQRPPSRLDPAFGTKADPSQEVPGSPWPCSLPHEATDPLTSVSALQAEGPMELAHLNTLSLEGQLHAQPGKDWGPTLPWVGTSGCCCDMGRG